MNTDEKLYENVMKICYEIALFHNPYFRSISLTLSTLPIIGEGGCADLTPPSGISSITFVWQKLKEEILADSTLINDTLTQTLTES